MPNIPDAVITYNSSDTVTSSQLAWNANQTDYMPKQTQPIFKNINWGRSGIFLYEVYEEQSGVTITDSSRQTVYYSQAVYEIAVYVVEKENQPGFYVWAIGATRTVTDTGSTTGSEIGKVDPRPDGDPAKPELGKYSKLIFSNNYLKHGSGDPDDPKDMMLKVSKTTKGLGSNSSLFFNFSITIEKPIISQKTVYTVYVFQTPIGGGSPEQLTSSELQEIASSYVKSGGYLELPTGQPVSFKLKHNQYLSFVDMDEGATYKVTEQAATDYTPSYQLTINGAMGNKVNGTQGQSLPMTSAITITSGKDEAAFTNTYKTITPTGIAVDDLPYYAAIAIAVIGLGGYLFYRIRSRKENEVAVEAN